MFIWKGCGGLWSPPRVGDLSEIFATLKMLPNSRRCYNLYLLKLTIDDVLVTFEVVCIFV